MRSVDLMDFFATDPVKAPPDLATRASFSIPDIERMLRENKELRAERDELRATMVEIKEMIEQWQAVRKALHG